MFRVSGVCKEERVAKVTRAPWGVLEYIFHFIRSPDIGGYGGYGGMQRDAVGYVGYSGIQRDTVKIYSRARVKSNGPKSKHCTCIHCTQDTQHTGTRYALAVALRASVAAHPRGM